MKCNGKIHNLCVIYRDVISHNEDAVVRWCKDCGAVVVDVDSKTASFALYSMRFPTMIYPTKRYKYD